MFHNKYDASGNKGQAMVEFALILLVLLFIIFVIVEGARLLQANLTAQNAARAAGRYGATGQFDPSCLADSPPCEDPRVASIKEVARENLAGLNLDDSAAYEDPNYYLIEVIGTDENGNQIPDYAGAPGMPVMVRVTYRVGMVTPLVRPIARTVRIIGQTVFNNELYTQISRTSSPDSPQLTPFPTPGASPTPSPPDIEVSKSSSMDPAIVGEEFDYIIEISNVGQSAATNVKLVDTLQSGISFVDGPAGCDYDEDNDIVTCQLSDIDGNASTSVNLTVVADNSVGDTTVPNEATVTADGDSDTATEETFVTGVPSDADLVLNKGASASLIAVGEEMLFVVSVMNNPDNPDGLADATNVTVVDTLPDPAGMSFVSAAASQGGCNYDAGSNEVTCNLEDVDRGDSANVSIRMRAEAEGTYTNNATVSADQDEPSGAEGNNSDSAQVEVQNVADLGVTKLASADPGVGEPVTYTVNVFNNGPVDATGVQVADELPPSVNFISASASQGSGCNYNSGANTVSCGLGTLSDGGPNATVSIVVVPTQVGNVTNVASVAGAEADPFSPNDEFILNTQIQPRADLTVTKTGSEIVQAGDPLDYTVTVANDGPSPATEVHVNDTLPPDVTFVSASASQGTCGGSNSAVTCNLGQMASGASATVSIRVIPNLAGVAENNVGVTTSTTDPDTDNNNDSWTTTVEATNEYIVLSQVCGDPGDTITINGYNWSTDNQHNEISIRWNGTEITTVPKAATWQIDITVPANAADGQHTVEAFQAGVGSHPDYSDTAQVTVPCPAPNLIISQPEAITSAPIVAGEAVTFTAEVRNVGNLDAVSQFFAGLYFDPTPAPVLGSSTHISQTFRQGIVAINGLAVGAGKTVTFTVENGFDSAGTHDVYAVADSDPGPQGVIDGEHDETDNISTPLQVDVEPAPTATPTATGTPGPNPTPTSTPTPAPTEEPGSLVVSVYNEEGQPQANAEVNVIDESDGTVVATGHTNLNGNYLFQGLPPGTYTVTACIDIEDVDHYAFVTGVPITSGGVTQRILFLSESPGGCT